MYGLQRGCLRHRRRRRRHCPRCHRLRARYCLRYRLLGTAELSLSLLLCGGLLLHLQYLPLLPSLLLLLLPPFLLLPLPLPHPPPLLPHPPPHSLLLPLRIGRALRLRLPPHPPPPLPPLFPLPILLPPLLPLPVRLPPPPLRPHHDQPSSLYASRV